MLSLSSSSWTLRYQDWFVDSSCYSSLCYLKFFCFCITFYCNFRQFFSWLLSVTLLVTFWITLYSHTDLLDLGSLADAKRRLPVSCSHLCTIQGKGVDVRNSSSTLCIRHYPTRFHWSTFLPGIIDRVLNYSHISFYESHLSVHIGTSVIPAFRGIKQEFRSKMRSRQMLDAWKGPPANIAASGHIYNRRKA